jgi:transposase
MIAAATIMGIDVSRDWLDGFCLPGKQRFRHPNTAEGHVELITALQCLSGPVKVGFEATGGQEWTLWTRLAAAGIDAAQLPPARIKAFALSRGKRAKTDRIDAEFSARFMVFRPEAGRDLPDENLRILRALTTRRAQIVGLRKRLIAQIGARTKLGVPADIESMDDDLKAMLDAQIGELESRIECVIARVQTLAAKAGLLRSIPGSAQSPRRYWSPNCRNSAG